MCCSPTSLRNYRYSLRNNPEERSYLILRSWSLKSGTGSHTRRPESSAVESNWNVMAHGEAREGKWRGNWRMEWVASTHHTTSEHGVSSITTADAHTSAASSRLDWRPPADLNGLVRLAERRNLVSARVPSHFKRSLPLWEPQILYVCMEADSSICLQYVECLTPHDGRKDRSKHVECYSNKINLRYWCVWLDLLQKRNAVVVRPISKHTKEVYSRIYGREISFPTNCATIQA